MDAPNEREWYDDWRGGSPQLGMSPTPRQIEVFLAVVRLATAEAAATELGISYQTVKNHMTGLMARMGAQNRADLARIMWETFPDMRPLMGAQPEPENAANDANGTRPSSDGLYIERREGQRRK